MKNISSFFLINSFSKFSICFFNSPISFFNFLFSSSFSFNNSWIFVDLFFSSFISLSLSSILLYKLWFEFFKFSFSFSNFLIISLASIACCFISFSAIFFLLLTSCNCLHNELFCCFNLFISFSKLFIFVFKLMLSFFKFFISNSLLLFSLFNKLIVLFIFFISSFNLELLSSKSSYFSSLLYFSLRRFFPGPIADTLPPFLWNILQSLSLFFALIKSDSNSVVFFLVVSL